MAQAIASIELQDYPDFELVLVDDSDGTGEAAFLGDASPDLELKLVRADGENRLGPGNLAARKARGEHLLFLLEGAIAEPRLLSTLVGVAEASGAEVVSCVSRLEDEGATELIVPEGGPPLGGLFYRCFAGGGYLIRRDTFERLGGFDPAAEPASEDHELLCRAALDGCSMHVVPEPLLREPPPAGRRGIPIDHPQAGLDVLRAYESRAPQGLRDLARVARAHWLLARERGVVLESLLHSRSWRLTRPLRFVGEQGRRLRRALRGDRTPA
jgi:GT2 family glycosyltransferase